MAKNKVKLTINSRMYTVVSEENPEYIQMLGEHIDEKIQTVVKEGRNIMGERPTVLAALNICDEYYKLMYSKGGEEMAQIKELCEKNRILEDEKSGMAQEIEKLKAEQENSMQTEMVEKNAQLQNQLDEAHTQITFLEGKIKEMEKKAEDMKKEYERREEEIFEMFDNPKKPDTGDKK